MPAKLKLAAEPAILADYRPVPQSAARHDGWAAGRQRCFPTALAETGRTSQGVRPSGGVVASRLCPRQRVGAGFDAQLKAVFDADVA